jgi:hypothetical protein
VFVTHPVEEIDEVLRGQIAGRAGRIGTASGAAGRGVEAADPRPESGDDVGKGGAAGVVEVEGDLTDRNAGSDRQPGNSVTWLGTPTPIVSPKQTSSTPSSSSRRPTPIARSGWTAPLYGSPKAVET